MGNHNVLIVNPKGERRHQFAENVSLDVARDFIHEYGPAPIGWHYQIVNLNKRKRRLPDHVMVFGLKAVADTNEVVIVDERKARVKHNNGRWYTPRMAKRDARAQGAQWFVTKKVWDDGKAV
jgi:hypothetical protein